MAAIPYMVYGICGICSFYCFRVAEGVCSVGIGGCGCYFVVIYYSDGYKAVKVVVLGKGYYIGHDGEKAYPRVTVEMDTRG